MTIEAGKKAPYLVLKDIDDYDIKLSAILKESPILLIFTMRDECERCCGPLMNRLAEDFDKFEEKGADVVVVNVDPPKSHKAFEEKHGNIPFAYLSDPELKAAKKYGVINNAGTRAKHHAFIIGKDRVIRHIFPQYLLKSEEIYRTVFDVLEAVRIDIFQETLDGDDDGEIEPETYADL